MRCALTGIPTCPQRQNGALGGETASICMMHLWASSSRKLLHHNNKTENRIRLRQPDIVLGQV
jgi:hypothetical protein